MTIPAQRKVLDVGLHKVSLYFEPVEEYYQTNAVVASYRGQPFECKEYLPYARINLDLMSGKADAWLSASRDKIAPNAISSLNMLILEATKARVKADLLVSQSASSNSENNDPLYSRFFEVMALVYGGEWCDFAKQLDRKWLDLSFRNREQTFRDFFNGDGGVIAEPLKYSREDNEQTDYVAASSSDDPMTELVLKSWVTYKGGSVCAIEPKRENEVASKQYELSHDVSGHLKKR